MPHEWAQSEELPRREGRGGDLGRARVGRSLRIRENRGAETFFLGRIVG